MLWSKIKYNKNIKSFILILSIYIILQYSLDLKIIYPNWLIEIYHEPIFKIFLLSLLYILSNIDIIYGIIYFIFYIFIEYDHKYFFK